MLPGHVLNFRILRYTDKHSIKSLLDQKVKLTKKKSPKVYKAAFKDLLTALPNQPYWSLDKEVQRPPQKLKIIS